MNFPYRQNASRAWMLAASVLVLSILLVGGCSDPDTAIFARLSEADQARFRSGRQVAVPCWTCHDLAGTVKKVGPSLLGVYGRKSGQAPEYVGSPAMLSASIVWDDRMLSAFLASPAGFIPGNRMVSSGVPNASARADLLFYLKHVSEPGARLVRPGDDVQ